MRKIQEVENCLGFFVWRIDYVKFKFLCNVELFAFLKCLFLFCDLEFYVVDFEDGQ